MGQYKLIREAVPALPDVHGGTGDISASKHVVFWGSVTNDVKAQLVFNYERYMVTVMCFRAEGIGTPDWFGVCFRQGLSAFDSVNIMCHPSPGNAGMEDKDYGKRGGKWPSLFRYAEMLGSQMAIAGNNQIVVVPFFNNAAYTSTGGFGPNWQRIINDILAEVRAEANKMSMAEETVTLRNVVLSDFSFGRHLMHNLRARCPGLNTYLREVWDFDGVGPGVPYSSGSVRGILYDQHPIIDPRSYHVPPQRWLGFHHKLVPSVHSNIPDMLGVHAAKMSNVGK